MALHLNDAEAFKTFMTSWGFFTRYRQDDIDFYHGLFNQSFAEEWLNARVPSIRDSALPPLIGTAHQQATPMCLRSPEGIGDSLLPAR